MHAFQHHVAELCYGAGADFFWAMKPQVDDVLDVIFDQDSLVERVVVETGNKEHPNDFLRSADLEISPQILRRDKHGVLCADYVKLGQLRDGRIDAQGVAAHTGRKYARCLRVRVTQTQSEWVVFYQMAVWTRRSNETLPVLLPQ